jgi:MFS transporter, DHA2 family, multidrug resistance protein
MRRIDVPAKFSKWIIAIAVMSSAIMEVLDTSVVNVSLRHIAGNLSATVDEATWVLTSYLVANACILPLTGWLSHYIGRKRLLLTVVTGFTVSSILCGLAPSLPALIFFRVMQGITGGGLQPLSQAVLLEEFPKEEHGKAMAFWGFGIVAAPILGPTVGGWLTETLSWRWVFYINLPIGILSFILLSLFLYDPPYLKRGTMRIDAWGLGLLVVGMGALQMTLDKGQEEDWFESRFIATLIAVATVALIAFVARELAVKHPLVKFRLFLNRDFACGIGVVFTMSFVLYGSLVLLPLFMQELLGWTAITAGFWTSPRGIASGLCMPLVGYLLGKKYLDPRVMLVFGFVVASAAFFGYSRSTLQSGTWNFFTWQIVQGTGISFVFIPLTTITMSRISKADMGYATSLYSVMRNIASSAGISFVTTFLARRSQFHQTILGANLTPSNPRVTEFLAGTAHAFALQGADTYAAKQQSLSTLYRLLVQQSTLMSFAEAFRVMGTLFLCVIPLIFFMRKRENARKS